jgi:hypothetical protein
LFRLASSVWPERRIDTKRPDEVGDRLFSATNQGINQLGATDENEILRRSRPKSAAEGRTHGAAEEEMLSW